MLLKDQIVSENMLRPCETLQSLFLAHYYVKVADPWFADPCFDRTFVFGAHDRFLCSKFYPRHKALRCSATVFWGPSKDLAPSSISVYDSLPALLCASPEWFSFLSNTQINQLKILH